MTATSPYRTPAKRPSRAFVVPLLALPRAVAVVLGVVLVVPIVMYIFLWSRVVTVRCERAGDAALACAVDEATLASSSHAVVPAQGAVAAALRGATYRVRGDAWIVLVGQGGETPLTSGFNGDKDGQAAAAKALTAFFRDPTAKAVTVSFGSRWFPMAILGGLDAILLLLGAALLGQRLHVTIDRGRDEIAIRCRLWPLRGSRTQLPYSRLARFEVERLPKGKYRLVARTKEEASYPVSWTMGTDVLLERPTKRLNQLVEAEREDDQAGEVAPGGG